MERTSADSIFLAERRDCLSNEEQNTLSFFHLPYPIQVEIVSYLSMTDTKSFAEISTEADLLTKDQIVWRKKLWNHSRVINLCLEGRKSQPKNANFLVKDPLLVDMKKLYEVLMTPEEQCLLEYAAKEVDRENFLSKVQKNTAPGAGANSNVMSFSSVGLHDLFNFLNTFFHRPPPIFYDPFSRGTEAPSFILFGPPETRNARKLALSFIASKNSVFETVGLVKGRPGGIGGGVTVESGNRLMNLLPVRRARPRLLVEDSSGEVSFHPDVAQAMNQIDGMIYYLDAKCTCGAQVVPRHKNGLFTQEQQKRKKSARENGPEVHEIIHTLESDLYELRAMLKATEDILPPILVILVHSEEGKSPQKCEESSDEELNHLKDREERDAKEDVHAPSDLLHKMHDVENPWMISKVEVNSLKGVHQGINWLYERTRILQGK